MKGSNKKKRKKDKMEFIKVNSLWGIFLVYLRNLLTQILPPKKERKKNVFEINKGRRLRYMKSFFFLSYICIIQYFLKNIK